jgi:hypothetical protein
VLTVEGEGRAVLTPLREQIKNGRGLFRKLARKRSLADELIEERRNETSERE